MEGPLLISLTMLFYVIGAICGLIVGSLLGAVFLRLAALGLRFPNVSFLAAFRSVLLANFCVMGQCFLVGLNQGLAIGMFGDTNRFGVHPAEMLLAGYQPTFFLLVMVMSLLLTAAIFCNTLPDKDGSAMSFTRAVALAAFYQAIFVLFLVVAFILLFAIVPTWINVFQGRGQIWPT